MKFIVEGTNQIDLHIHTNYSDGLSRASILADYAANIGLECIAFTDHNADLGRKSCKRINKKSYRDLKIIPGCEISVKFNGKRIHLLAYNYNPVFSSLVLPKLEKMRNEKQPISLQKACKLVHYFGGKAVLAHPFKYKYDGKELVKELIEEKCIDGIECIHSYHTQEEIDYLLDICAKHDLYVSAGSDFHYKGQTIRGEASQHGLGYLAVTNSTIEDQIIRAKEKYNYRKR